MKNNDQDIKNQNNDFDKYLYLFTLFLTFIFCIFLYRTGALLHKYLVILILALIILVFIYTLMIKSRNKKRWISVGCNILAILLLTSEGFVFYKVDKILTIIQNNVGTIEQTNIYYVIVRKDSDINNIEDLRNKKIFAMKENKKLENILYSKVNVHAVYGFSMNELFENVLKDNSMVILVNSGYYEGIIDNDDEFESKVKIIYTIEVKEELKNNSNEIDITKEPFLLYISAIDTRTNTMPAQCLSDVNIIMAINPKTHQILMVNIPRDMYVDVKGQEGLKDKLTHAGMNGGISLSIATIEDFMNLKLPYYVRVNFNALKDLVDAVGGITVYSDVNYTIKSYHESSCYIKPGNNTYDGKCAVAFARERVGYVTSDRHRAENEEQMIEKLIEKISSSKVILKNFDKIITSIDGSFETNITMNEITNVIKMQIGTMPSWNIEKYNISGTPNMLPTYSFPEKNLYVVEPDMNTVEEATQKLSEILEYK